MTVAQGQGGHGTRDGQDRAAAPCAFCGIVAGDQSAHEVYRDDDLVGFLDTKPVFPGHVLLIPTRHLRTYDQLPGALAAHWLEVSQSLQRAVEEAMASQGSLLIMNNVVSQSVPHLHLHVIPRTKGDGLRFWLGPRHPYPGDAEAAAVAARIAASVR
ncbi:MAG: HIT family protein [Microbacteriaceae bacterium]